MARLLPDGRIALTDGLRLTLQRCFTEDWQPGDARPSRSYGRIPFVQKPGTAEFTIPILPGEHTWIGLEAQTVRVPTSVSIQVPNATITMDLTCPPDYAIKGIPKDAEYLPISIGDVLIFSVEEPKGGEIERFRLAACPADEALSASKIKELRSIDRRDGFVDRLLP